MRISDADRELAALRLQRAMAEGRITIGELEERLDIVYAARHEDDLDAPLADLPAEDARYRPTGAPVVLRGWALRRFGSWTVPPRLRVQCPMGSAYLDFRDAELSHDVVDVELDARCGAVTLVLPKGATADLEGLRADWGAVSCRLPSAPRAGAPHFVVHGRSWLGTVSVRRRRFRGTRR